MHKQRPHLGGEDKPTKISDSIFCCRHYLTVLAVEASVFAQGRTIDREGQYPWVLASGGVKPLRKSRRLNLVLTPEGRSPKHISP